MSWSTYHGGVPVRHGLPLMELLLYELVYLSGRCSYMLWSTFHGGVPVCRGLPVMEVLLYVVVYLSWRCCFMRWSTVKVLLYELV